MQCYHMVEISVRGSMGDCYKDFPCMIFLQSCKHRWAEPCGSATDPCTAARYGRVTCSIMCTHQNNSYALSKHACTHGWQTMCQSTEHSHNEFQADLRHTKHESVTCSGQARHVHGAALLYCGIQLHRHPLSTVAVGQVPSKPANAASPNHTVT